jgi:hypothetical protein
MTPEERLTKVETLLHAVTEQQAKQVEEVERQNEAIRGLIVVGRTLLDSMQESRQMMDRDHDRFMAELEKLREAQAATDEKLNILIDTVDRIIRRRNGKE